MNVCGIVMRQALQHYCPPSDIENVPLWYTVTQCMPDIMFSRMNVLKILDSGILEHVIGTLLAPVNHTNCDEGRYAGASME